MKILCLSELLLEGLNVVTRVLSSRTTLEILEGVLLKADENGIKLFASNLEMSIETNIISSQVYERGEIVLDGRMLHDIVKKFNQGTMLSISLESGFLVVIESGRTRYSLIGMNPEQYPSLPAVEPFGIFELSIDTFKKLLRQVLYAVAVQDTSRPVLTGALIEQWEDDELRVVALDGMRMAYAGGKIKGMGGSEKLKVIIPAQALNEVIRISGLLSGRDEQEAGQKENDNLLKLSAGRNHVIFDIQGVIVTSRILEGEFIDYNQVFNVEQNIMVRLARAGMVEGLERVALINAKDIKKSPIRIIINDEQTMLLHSSSAIGTAQEVVLIEETELMGSAKARLEIGFNPKYLIEALKSVDSEHVTISFNSALSPCIVRPAREGENSDSYDEFSKIVSKHLVLPVRLESQ